MKIVVTGSESFVGKELISQCKTKGIEVIGLDSRETESTNYEFHKVDIRASTVADFIPVGIDAIVHLAALSRDADCRGRAYECFDINVMGSLNLIRVASKKNVKQFIFASSEWVYNEFQDNELKDEDSPIDISRHTSEYALSKLVTEANLKQQYQRGFCPVTILRFGIIYGPRKDNWSAMEAVFNSVKHKSEVMVGSLKTARRYIHVKDIGFGIIKSIGVHGFNVINLTGNKVITLEEIIEKSQKIVGKSVKILETTDQANIRNPSNERAKKVLDWEPTIDLEAGLKTLNAVI